MAPPELPEILPDLMSLLGETHTFQTFDDSSKKNIELVRVLHGALADNTAELQRLNAKGAGIFFAVNQTDGKGRREGNITAVRALFADFDKPDANRSFAYYLPPSVIVESSPGKHHAYWLTSDLPLDDFTGFQGKLALMLGSDLKVKDTPRVMRVPGFNHLKKEPFPVRVVGGCGVTYTADELKDWIDSTAELCNSPMPVKVPKERSVDPATTCIHSKDDPDAVKILKAWLEELSEQGEGGRNDALNKIAYLAYGLCAAGRLGYDDVTSQLVETALEIGLEEAEAHTTCRSAKGTAVPIPNDLDSLPLLEAVDVPTVGTDGTVRCHMEGYTITGTSAEQEKNALEQVFVLGSIAPLGQITIIYAKPNTGKTLLVLSMLTESIRAGRIQGNDVFYINADDNSIGLLEKTKLAEQEGGFHILTPGAGIAATFNPKLFAKDLRRMVKEGTAKNKIVVLDTLKKFADTMDKKGSSEFMSELRSFVAVGQGTVIMLAHVNKHADDKGESIAAGTTDSLDDSDCAYILQEIGLVGYIKTVEFIRKKSRGGGFSGRSLYSYSVDPDLEYPELINSVKELTSADEVEASGAALLDKNSDVIAQILIALEVGKQGTDDIKKYASREAGVGQSAVHKVLKAHTGTDYRKGHRWSVAVGGSGQHVYTILSSDGESCLDGLPEMPE